MKTSSLEILERSALPGAQAQAILAVVEQEMTDADSNLATRSDLAALRSEVLGELKAFRAEMTAFKESMKDTMATKAEVNALGSKLSWMVLNCFFVQLGVSVGLASLLYTLLKR